MNGGAALAGRYGRWPEPRAAAIAAGIGLWVFMGVATALFSLFLVAYVMRMSGSDAVQIALPWQLWLSSALLAAGSVALQRSAAAARGLLLRDTRRWLLAGGLGALGFLAVQWWAWAVLLAAQVMPAGNPGGSFFYLLTAVHGLHVAGGVAAWAWTARAAWQPAADPASLAWRIALCARYWHFLLAVWVVLFAALGWLTPEVARFICGVSS
ncbi:bb3-type cytochrome oxidase subunit III [Variovorax sp. JS1663]|uniref:bb3-type cytochrome oxidase subunit III n=1 Tax=Variovorax sp. JS1663 TaxID=1851577 RepID=UPI000B342230|nr:bb3-type cytochrome oxidase subunit III [Variovorax sp. JS1663]OUL99255.1 bb3-type cytochrome oxidase subunit III [Variovorax sp. JS1663]